MNINLMSSNIRYDNPNDAPHLWSVRKFLLSDLYKKFDLDILGTQEGRREQLLELSGLVDSFHLIDQHRSWIDERMYPTLFVKKEKFDVLGSGDIWLSETPDVLGSKSFKSAFPRLCTWATLKSRENNFEFTIANAHLDHILQSTRLAQTNVLIAELKKLSRLPTILLGDFNESPETEIQKKLREELTLSDPWTKFKKPEETSHHGFMGDECPSGERIDWVLISQEFNCQQIDLIKEKSDDNIFPSDHYPLLATLTPKCK